MPHRLMKVQEAICGICECRIKENTLFSTLTESELDALKGVVSMFSFKKKELIFMEGDECRGFYVVRQGRVKLVRTAKDGREQIIKICSPGELFGLEVFNEEEHYGNNAIAMEDTDVCFIKKEDFFSVLRKKPTIANKILIALGRELHQAYERIGSLGIMNAREKLASLLYTLATEYGVECDEGIRLNLTLSRLEIAELLGITQETSIRLLKSFKEEGIIKIRRKEIIITSMDRLAEIGGVL